MWETVPGRFIRDWRVDSRANLAEKHPVPYPIDYLRRPMRRYTTRALDALAKIDPSLARGEAQSLLARPESQRLSEKSREALRRY